MDQYIRLADGTVIKSTWCLLAGDRLIIYLEEAHTLGELVEIFGDPEKTAEITADKFGTVTEYRGYTHLKALSEETEGAFYTVSMVKGAEE